MKKLIILFGILLSAFSSKSQNPDVLIDSVKITSPYWGLEFESGTVQSQDTFFLNCGSSNANFVLGQPYLLARFPIQLANMGNSVAYFGTYGQNGITHDPCYLPQNVSDLDFINIPNFVTSYILDSCGNVISSNRKTDWNIQNNTNYALDYSNGQVIYPTQYFTLPPTSGNDPNPLKDWLESKCGPLDPNLANVGLSLMNNYYNNCQICDSLVLFPNYVSDDQGIVQLPTNLSPGNYYLAISGNFYMLNQGANCYSDSICIPFNWDGSTGRSSAYPYFANGITFLNSGFPPCSSPIAPEAPLNVQASAINSGNGQNSNTVAVNVTWSQVSNATSYVITPYLVVSGNAEKALNSLAKDSNGTSVLFAGSQLRSAQEVNQMLSTDKRNLKFRFKVKAINSSGSSSETSTGNPAIMVK